MRVAIVVSDTSYPPREGLHTVPSRLARALSDAGHEVMLCGFVRDRGAIDSAELERSAGLTRPPGFQNYSGQMLVRAARERLSPSRSGRHVAAQVRHFEPDVVHLDGRLACAIRGQIAEIPALSSLVDSPSLRELRLLKRSSRPSSKIKAHARVFFAKNFERSLRRRDTLWHFVSDVDAAHARQVHRGQECISVSQFFDIPERGFSRDTTRSVGIIADMRQPYLASDVFRTVAALEEVLPPDVPIVVLGRAAQEDLRWGDLPERVRYVDWVDDMERFIAERAVVVLPDSYGTGIKTRTLDLLAHGTSIVASTVACEGIPLVDGTHVLVRDDPSSVAAAVTQLLADEARRSSLEANARRLAQQMRRDLVSMWIDALDRTIELHRYARLTGDRPK